tara:strand:- start:1056 stop:1769 length:714 start_codon:yes stop_codon:yes gene_type:complete
MMEMIALDSQLIPTKGSTLRTRNEKFDTNGFFFLPNLVPDPTKLECDVPEWRGSRHYYGSVDNYSHVDDEGQVDGSSSRYNWPAYKDLHTKIRLEIEQVLGKKLYNTYYYDRFYFLGQELEKHVDRDACEISVSLMIKSNLRYYHEWPFIVDSSNQDLRETWITTAPGDAIIYKGCEIPHWRPPLTSKYGRDEPKYKLWARRILRGRDDTFWHQAFFHYVLADGNRCEHAFDVSNRY